MKQFLIDTVERAIRTAAQTAIASIGVASTIGEVNWQIVVSTVCLSTGLAILTAIAGRNIGDQNSASLVKKGEQQ